MELESEKGQIPTPNNPKRILIHILQFFYKI